MCRNETWSRAWSAEIGLMLGRNLACKFKGSPKEFNTNVLVVCSFLGLSRVIFLSLP